MILSDQAIMDARLAGDVVIEPFDQAHLGPNSYDVMLGPTLLTFRRPWWGRRFLNWLRSGDGILIDTRLPHDMIEVHIPPQGIVLRPGVLYLGSVVEQVGSTVYLPDIDGRSTSARQGISVHLTAGRGDVGFIGHFTLEITCIHPVRIYPAQRLCQVYFTVVNGNVEHRYDAGGHRYANQPDRPVAARIPAP